MGEEGGESAGCTPTGAIDGGTMLQPCSVLLLAWFRFYQPLGAQLGDIPRRDVLHARL